jgi:hypothetical protein
MIRILNIPAESVRARDTASLEALLQKIAGNPEQARQFQGTIALGFPDFEAQGSAYVTREVRGYVHAAHERVPHLFYFMMPEPQAAAIVGFLAAYASDADVSLSPKRNTQVNPNPELLLTLSDHLTNCALFAQRMADDGLGIVSRLLQRFDPNYRDVLMKVLKGNLGQP